MLKKIYRSESGFGMIDTLIGAIVLAVAIKAFMDISEGLSNKEADYNKKGLIGFGNNNTSMVISKMSEIASEIRKSIVNSSHPSNKNIFDQGLCPYVSVPTPTNGPGIVNLSVFKNSDASTLANSWKSQENHVHITSADHVDCTSNSNYSFCLGYDIHTPVLNQTEKLMEELDYVLLVKITPQEMVSTAQGMVVRDIDTSNPFIKNIKNITFNISIEAKTTVKGVRGSHFSRTTAWAGDLGVCTIGGKRVLPLADGYGDKDGNAIYNIVSYDGNPVQGQTLSGVFENLHIQEGIVISAVDTGVQLQSKLTGSPSGSLPTAMNCAEKEFKCRGIDSNTRNYGPSLVSFTTDLTANGGQVLVPVEGNPTLRVSNGGGSSVSSSSLSYKFNGEDYIESGGNIKHKVSGNQLVFAGSDKLDIAINDSVGSNSANSMCRSICQPGNSYNDVPGASQYRGRLIIEAPTGGADILNMQDPKGISCTSCYMKNCSRFGLSTFGKMNDMPNEPLDSGLPECAVRVPTNSINVEYSGALAANSCLKAKWNGNDLEYAPEPCATPLPTLCYNFGKYLLAQDLFAGPSKSISLQPFLGAAKRCYEMGREVIDSVELGNLLGQQGVNMVTTSPYNSLIQTNFGTPPIPVFQIMNLAKQGMFLAPEVISEKTDSKNWFSENSINTSNYFWTNLKTDSVGNIYAPVPFMHLPTSPNFNDTIAAYYSEDVGSKGNFVMKDLTSNILSHSSGAADRGLLLFNNIRFRGALSVDNSNPFGGSSFRYLCRKKNAPFSYFASSSTGNNQSGGIGACNSEAGFFVPPLKPHDWVRAMLLASPNDSKYPFPDPNVTGVSSITSINPIWIAYQGSSNLSSDWTAYPIPELGQILNSTGPIFEKVNKSGVVVSGTKDGIICIENNNIDGYRYQAGPVATTCSGGDVRLRKSDLFGVNNLINRIKWLFSKKDFPLGKAFEI